MRVSLVACTENADMVVASAARQCYSGSSYHELYDKYGEDKAVSLIKQIINVGHESVLEHASFTFAIEGISRVCSHELVRHRIASHSQVSQRYVKEDEMFDYVTPPSLELDSELLSKYMRFMRQSFELYSDFIKSGIPAEDARFVLPNAKDVKIVVTMNARSLRNFFKLRMCDRAQWEINALATEMHKLVSNKYPTLFYKSGPTCETTGKCPEGARCCGRLNRDNNLTANN